MFVEDGQSATAVPLKTVAFDQMNAWIIVTYNEGYL